MWRKWCSLSWFVGKGVLALWLSSKPVIMVLEQVQVRITDPRVQWGYVFPMLVPTLNVTFPACLVATRLHRRGSRLFRVVLFCSVRGTGWHDTWHMCRADQYLSFWFPCTCGSQVAGVPVVVNVVCPLLSPCERASRMGPKYRYLLGSVKEMIVPTVAWAVVNSPPVHASRRLCRDCRSYHRVPRSHPTCEDPTCTETLGHTGT